MVRYFVLLVFKKIQNSTKEILISYFESFVVLGALSSHSQPFFGGVME